MEAEELLKLLSELKEHQRLQSQLTAQKQHLQALQAEAQSRKTAVCPINFVKHAFTEHYYSS